MQDMAVNEDVLTILRPIKTLYSLKKLEEAADEKPQMKNIMELNNSQLVYVQGSCATYF